MWTNVDAWQSELAVWQCIQSNTDTGLDLRHTIAADNALDDDLDDEDEGLTIPYDLHDDLDAVLTGPLSFFSSI